MPTDYFARLELPRRPRVPEEQVRDAFHRLAASHHPDQAGGSTEGFAELTAAFEALRHPVSLLRHLIELEGLASESARAGLPNDLMDLFPRIAECRQQLAAGIGKRRSAPNSLARSLAAAELATIRASAEGTNQKIDQLYESALAELDRLDALWPSEEARAALPALQTRFAFLTKWRDQLREALLQVELS